MFCSGSACGLGLWGGICIFGGLVLAGTIGVLLGLFLHRRSKKTGQIPSVQR